MKTRWRAVCCLLLCAAILLPISPAFTPPARVRGDFASPGSFLTIRMAFAQSNAGAFISAPDVKDFPRVQTYLEVQDTQGNFIRGLTADQISVIEDGSPRPASLLQLEQPGVQAAVAINPGPSFAIRNAKAVSRYDLIKEALRAWALSRTGSTIDDLSLLITNGPAVSHSSEPGQLVSTLTSETVDPRAAVPTLDTLFKAVNLATDPTPRPGMSRAVLFVTPPPEGKLDEASLENLAAQAREQHIAIYIWLVSSSGAFGTQTAQQLTQLSQATGGRAFNFTGEEILPGLEEYFAPLRYIYRLEYQSGAAAGTHEISVQVETGEASIVTPTLPFEIDILPPRPAIVAPPIQIERTLKPAEGPAASPAADQPQAAAPADEQQIQVVFDFPDGRMRDLVYSALLVDGAVVDENSQPPFDRFTWNLEAITASGVHRLQVQARDTFGLTGESLETPVQVSVKQPGASALSGFQRNLPIISVLVAALAGAVLLLVLVIGGKLRPRPLRAARQRRKADPVTQPVHISIEAPTTRRASWASRIQRPGNSASNADAFLNPLPESPDDDTLPPIPITANELILGSDAEKVTLLLNDPSVEPVHARLTRQADNSYRLADEGSIAGTWINFTPVSKEGARLENGDLIHIGRIGFRFTLRKPAASRKPMVVKDPGSAVFDDGGLAASQDSTAAKRPVDFDESDIPEGMDEPGAKGVNSKPGDALQANEDIDESSVEANQA